VKKLRILVASGPTREPIDPVRYLSNYSTGAMGEALARAVRRRGHRLTWVRSPEDAETARDLLKKLSALLPKNDVLMMASAVCDARPVQKAATKIKKAGFKQIRLTQNPDLLAELARKKKKSQIFIGFALESKNLLENGFDKLLRKKLEAILLQRVTENNAPFGKKTIDAILLRKDSSLQAMKGVSKDRIAAALVREAEKAALVA
jgi:phosphopantothenoylcysteine decarboxylase/phosphopantothenate--cysteine ligase